MLAFALLHLSHAAAPAQLPVQARLLDAQGTPIEAPTTVSFALYTAPTGGSPVFSELRTVDPDDGYFALFLGDVSPLDWSIIDGSAPLYLGITLADSAELPRQAVGTVPFAAFADRAARADSAAGADTLEGLDVDGVVAEVVATYPSILDPYTDADARSAVAAEDRYVQNAGDVVTGQLVVSGGVRTAVGSQPAFPTVMGLSRGGSTVISVTTPGGVVSSLDVAGGTGLVSNGILAYVPGSAGGSDGRVYVNINGVPSMACTLLHSDDDGIRYGIAFATDAGNGMAGIWGNSDTRTFLMSQQGQPGLPLAINASYHILCM